VRAPLARSIQEVRLYVDSHPCECGALDFRSRRSATPLGEDFLVEYAGKCVGCRRRRSFVFTMHAKVALPEPGAWSELDEPSQLFDPGEWLRLADVFCEPYVGDFTNGAARERGTDEQERDRAMDLARAASAYDEALLFLPPGAAAVSGTLLRSAGGRWVLEHEPERLTREALELGRDTIRAAVREFHAWSSPDDGPYRARSPREAALFVEQRRCRCGMDRFEPASRLYPAESGQDRVLLTFQGTCPLCGAMRYTEFTVPNRPDGTLSGPLGYGLRYVGDGPSTLLDPGLFLALAAANGEHADRTDAELWDDAAELLCAAVACYDEVLLFIPDGADRVPAEAIRSAPGRVILRAHPDELHHDRIVAARDERRRQLDAILAAHADDRDGREPV
jgi:hypothetical protein